MIILGVESSCDETAASLVEFSGKKTNPRLRVLSNTISSQVKIHARFGGIVPEVAARKHAEVIIPIIQESLSNLKCQMSNVDLIAVSYGPGLVTSLGVGVDAAKTLAYIWKLPLVPVNHIEGHIYSNWLPPVDPHKLQATSYKLIKFPALVLVVSGGHTELVLMKDHVKYKIIGQTRDDAVGEAFDKVAKILGLGYPGGPAISALADSYKLRATSYKLELPRPMIDSPDYDFSFAGLKTAVLYKFRELQKLYPKKELVPLLACEFQNAALEVLVAKTMRAAKDFNVKTILLAGGVSANKKLRQDLENATHKLPGVGYIQPSLEYTTDNAAMIAVAGYFNYIRASKKYKDGWTRARVDPNLSL